MPPILSTITVIVDKEDNTLTKTDEPVPGGVRYVGEARIESGQSPADTDAVWRIRREIITGTQTFREFALLGQFLGKWSARTTYFTAIPTAFNQFSTMFDGVNDTALSTVVAYQFARTTPFSVSFWVKPATLVGAQCFAAVKTSSGANDGWSICQFATNTGLIRFQFMLNNTTNGLVMETTAATLSVNIWQHIAVTYDGTATPAGVKIYKNAVSQALTTVQNNFTSNPVYGAQFFAVGNFSTGTTVYSGRMDEVSVWNIALSGAQVAEIRDSGAATDLLTSSMAASLTSWYRMGDSDTFPTIRDVAVNAYDLTMTNMAASAFVQDVPP